ncbi:MAG: hypothetical protein GX197_07245 [Firmicutes bacterium]|nr:hypothetical protein [Bacillota bacterium]
MDFEHRFKERTKNFERWLFRGAALLLLLLILTQALLTQPEIRKILSLVDRLEGTPVAGNEPADASTETLAPVEREGYVELSIVEAKDLTEINVQVNGKTVATLGKNSTTVRIPVRDGDAVEIDGQIPEKNVQVAVTAVSEGIIKPQAGKEVTFYGVPEVISYVTMERD